MAKAIKKSDKHRLDDVVTENVVEEVVVKPVVPEAPVVAPLFLPLQDDVSAMTVSGGCIVCKGTSLVFVPGVKIVHNQHGSRLLAS